MDAWVRHKVGLELGKVHVQSTVKTKRGSDGRHNLSNEPVQICIGGTFDVQIATTDVIDGFIIDHKGTVRVLKSGVGGQDGVVRLNYSSGHLGSWVDTELKLGFLAIVNRQTLHKEGGKT